MSVGLALLCLGWAIAFLMTLRIIPPSLELSLLAYAASTSGLLIGMFGSAMYAREKQRPE